MRKKIVLVILILVVSVFACAFLVACKKTPPPTPSPTPSIEIKREDCDLVFGSGGIGYKGILAPIDSDPAIGGAVIATVSMTASGANLNVVANIIKLNITLKSGAVETIEDQTAVAQILTLEFSTGFTTINGKVLSEDTPADCSFKFTMPSTEDMKYVGASFSITVRVTVTHANDVAV